MDREALRHAIALEHLLYTHAQAHERQAARWAARVALARARGEPQLEQAALERQRREEQRAAECSAGYAEQAQLVRQAKLKLRAGAPATIDPLAERRLEELAAEDRLERDLAELKAKLALKA